LEEFQVRLVRQEEFPRFQSLPRWPHYRQGIKPVGERLYYVAVWRGQDPRRAKVTLPDFHEEMSLEHQRRAFALINAKKSHALEAS
jgi:hypothetical protein